MSKKIKLMPDYECSPLWDIEGGGEITPDELPLSEETSDRLKRWARKYDRTLDKKDPESSGFESSEEEEAFEVEGRKLWEDIQKELGEDYEVFYFSQTESELLS